MRKRFWVLAAPVLATALIAFSSRLAAAGRLRLSPPTPAPTATPGPAPTEWVPPLPTLPGGPLRTPEQVLQPLLDYDQRNAVWEHPWSLDTLRSDPSRITLAWFPSRTAESGGTVTYGLGLDAAAGPVWRVTIRGHVHIGLIGIGIDPSRDRDAVYDGLTYVIAQDSGALLGVDTGAPVPGAAPLLLPGSTSPASRGPYP